MIKETPAKNGKRKTMKKTILTILAVLVLGLALSAALYKPLIQPWVLTWGAEKNEIQASLAGDEMITGNLVESTRAVSISAPAGSVWPWLLQIGQGRGGFYSYDFLENLGGCDIHTLDTILPELQDLQVGDRIYLGSQETLVHYEVVLLEENAYLVMQSINPADGSTGETWGFYLQPVDAENTRLVIRHRSLISQDKIERMIYSVLEPISFMMEQRMLLGLRSHSEKLFAGIYH